MMIYYYKAPFCTLGIRSNGSFISAINFMEPDIPEKEVPENKVAGIALRSCIRQLDAYFAGTLKEFDFPMQQEGTDFQQRVWTALLTIPYGKTISYAALSKQLGDPKAIRAVGTANGRNQLAIVVPCHRVIGSDASLTGYAGGLPRKQWLLEHEAHFAHGVRMLF